MIAERRFCGLLALVYILFQLFRLACLVPSAILSFDCILNNISNTSLLASDSPICLASYSWDIVWLTCSILTSIIWICLLNQKVLPELRPVGYTVALKCLISKPHFWSLNCMTVIVTIYDFYAMRWQQNELQMASLFLLTCYKPMTLCLIYQLNFAYPPSKARDFRFTSIAGYFITLTIFFLENLSKVVSFTVFVASKVAVKGWSDILECLISTVISIVLYNSFLQFFWQKIFLGDKDILSLYNQNIADTSGIREHYVPDEDPEGGEGGSRPLSPHP